MPINTNSLRFVWHLISFGKMREGKVWIIRSISVIYTLCSYLCSYFTSSYVYVFGVTEVQKKSIYKQNINICNIKGLHYGQQNIIMQNVNYANAWSFRWRLHSYEYLVVMHKNILFFLDFLSNIFYIFIFSLKYIFKKRPKCRVCDRNET